MKYGSKISIGSIISKSIVKIIMLIYSLIVLFPMFWAAMSSFKSNKEFYVNVWALPKRLAFENYVNAWNAANIGTNILNSILIVSLAIILTMILAATTAYAITRYNFFGHKLIGNLYITGLFVPLVLGTIPTFFVLRQLHLYDTRIGLILVYTAYSMPLSVFIMMGIFETIPSSFAEAAVIDGCSRSRIFWSIMMPLAKSGLFTISIFNFLWTWGDYIYAMTYLPSANKRTIPVGLVKLTSVAMYKTDWGALFACLVIVMLPSIVIYAIFQNQIQKGLTAGGIKG